MGDAKQTKARCCARCLNHNVRCTLRGHKPYCPFINCECTDCKVTKCRQTVMAADVKIRRRVPPPTTQGIALPGQTPTPATVPTPALIYRSEAEELGVISAMILKYCNNDTNNALQHAEKAYQELLKLGRPLEASIIDTPSKTYIPDIHSRKTTCSFICSTAEHRSNERKAAPSARDGRGLEDDPPGDGRPSHLIELEQLRHSIRSDVDDSVLPPKIYRSVLNGQHSVPPKVVDRFPVPTTTDSSHYAPASANQTTESSTDHADNIKRKTPTPEHSPGTLSVVPKPLYANLIPAATTHSSETSLERSSISITESRRSSNSRSAVDSDIGLFPKYSTIPSADLRLPNTRYPDLLLPVTTNAQPGLMPMSPTYHPTLNSHSNMAILEQSRALNTLPLDASKSYSLISLHSLLSSVNASTNSPSHLATAPTLLSSSFLNPLSYPSSTTSTQTPQAKFYIHTTEGRTLELLGCRSPLDSQSRMTLIPPHNGITMHQLAMDAHQATANAEKSKAHLLLGEDISSRDSLRSVQHLMPVPHQDNSSVWRPY